MPSRVAFLVVASMVLVTIVLAIVSTFTSNRWLLITTGVLATATALTTITTAILLSDDFAQHQNSEVWALSTKHIRSVRVISLCLKS